jgi:soluble lytic murein transglycosylase-like protein
MLYYSYSFLIAPNVIRHTLQPCRNPYALLQLIKRERNPGKLMKSIALVALLLLVVVTAERRPVFIGQFRFGPAPQPRLSAAETRAIIDAAATKHNVPAAFVKSIMAAESSFNPAAISAKGAIGLMQLMPETAAQYGVDPTIPAQNVDGGTHYLRELMTRYRKSNNWLRRVIAAYNAGPGIVDRYRGVPPYRETRAYVDRVLGYLRRFRKEG